MTSVFSSWSGISLGGHEADEPPEHPATAVAPAANAAQRGQRRPASPGRAAHVPILPEPLEQAEQGEHDDAGGGQEVISSEAGRRPRRPRPRRRSLLLDGLRRIDGRVQLGVGAAARVGRRRRLGVAGRHEIRMAACSRTGRSRTRPRPGGRSRGWSWWPPARPPSPGSRRRRRGPGPARARSVTSDPSTRSSLPTWAWKAARAPSAAGSSRNWPCAWRADTTVARPGPARAPSRRPARGPGEVGRRVVEAVEGEGATGAATTVAGARPRLTIRRNFLATRTWASTRKATRAQPRHHDQAGGGRRTLASACRSCR